MGEGEREKDRERCERKTSTWKRDINWLPPSHALTGYWTRNLGMCPARGSNLQPVGGVMLQPTEPPGKGIYLMPLIWRQKSICNVSSQREKKLLIHYKYWSATHFWRAHTSLTTNLSSRKVFLFNYKHRCLIPKSEAHPPQYLPSATYLAVCERWPWVFLKWETRHLNTPLNEHLLFSSRLLWYSLHSNALVHLLIQNISIISEVYFGEKVIHYW